MRTRYQAGTVTTKPRKNGPAVWVFRWREPDGKRRAQILGSTKQLPTKAEAMRASESLRVAANADREEAPEPVAIKFGDLIDQYILKECPTRYSTRRGYLHYLNTFIRSRWGDCRIEEVGPPQSVKDWLLSLDLAGKSRGHIKNLMSTLFNFAMCSGMLPMGRNPISTFKLKGSSLREKQPRSLTADEFQRFFAELVEPFRTIALTCVCLGLRISECLALKWSDVDWLNGRLRVERGIVRQNVGDVKTTGSRKQMSLDDGLLAVLRTWKQATQFSAGEDWVFASPAKAGVQPWSYPRVLQVFQQAAADAGVGPVSPHSLRHTYRSWLDAVGAPIAVQQKLMRHASITTTLNIYGDVVTDEMVQANSKVVEMVLPRSKVV
jgi:integrase